MTGRPPSNAPLPDPSARARPGNAKSTGSDPSARARSPDPPPSSPPAPSADPPPSPLPNPPPPAPPRRLVLVGFMGAGKSTVGSLVARSLGWEFVDLDQQVERSAGRAVAEIVRDLGLAVFRRMEAEAGRRALARDRVVVAAGGGWAGEPGRMAEARRAALTVWLQVRPATALARVEASGVPRPLLEDARNPLAAAEALLAERASRYALGDITIDTEGRSPAEVALEVLARTGTTTLARSGPARTDPGRTGLARTGPSGGPTRNPGGKDGRKATA